MNDERIEVIGIVMPEINRYRKEWGVEGCSFSLQCPEIQKVWCDKFIPDIRKGWKVKVIGFKEGNDQRLYAVRVERYNERPHEKGVQLTLKKFTGVKNA